MLQIRERAFTLLELMVAMGIIGLLTAIALPEYREYVENGYDRQAQVALRTVALAEEAYFIVNDQYLSCDQTNCQERLEKVPPIPAGVILRIVDEDTIFRGESYHSAGSGVTYYWNQ